MMKQLIALTVFAVLQTANAKTDNYTFPGRLIGPNAACDATCVGPKTCCYLPPDGSNNFCCDIQGGQCCYGKQFCCAKGSTCGETACIAPPPRTCGKGGTTDTCTGTDVCCLGPIEAGPGPGPGPGPAPEPNAAGDQPGSCCPYSNGVCCADGLICCVPPLICAGGGKCGKSPCDKGGVTCPAGQTCCGGSTAKPLCCPLDGAVCCDSTGVNGGCCPKGWTCNVAKATARAAGDPIGGCLPPTPAKSFVGLLQDGPIGPI